MSVPADVPQQRVLSSAKRLSCWGL